MSTFTISRAALARAGGVTVKRARAGTLPRTPPLPQRRALSAGRYVEQMREAWIKDKTSVHESWDNYFSKEPALSVRTSQKRLGADCALQTHAACSHRPRAKAPRR